MWGFVKVKIEYVFAKRYLSCGQTLFFIWSVFRSLSRCHMSVEDISDMLNLSSFSRGLLKSRYKRSCKGDYVHKGYSPRVRDCSLCGGGLFKGN